MACEGMARKAGPCLPPPKGAGISTCCHRPKYLFFLCLNHKCQVRICFIQGRRQETPPSNHRQNMGESRPHSHQGLPPGLALDSQQLADSSDGALTTSLGNLAQDSVRSSFECFPSYWATSPFPGGTAAFLRGPQVLTHPGQRLWQEGKDYVQAFSWGCCRLSPALLLGHQRDTKQRCPFLCSF